MYNVMYIWIHNRQTQRVTGPQGRCSLQSRSVKRRWCFVRVAGVEEVTKAAAGCCREGGREASWRPLTVVGG